MTTFWMLAVAMTAVALVFTIPPLFRSVREGQQFDRNQLNAEVIKDQLRELRADLETGKLEKGAYQAARVDLERELLNDLDDEGAATVKLRSGRWIAGILLVFIPGLAYLTYQQLGAPNVMHALANQPAAQTQRAGSGTPEGHSLEDMVQKLAERMRNQPDNAEGWIMLGRSYAALQRFQDASAAYAQAYRLVDDNAALMADYADTLVSANGGDFTDEAGVLLTKAVALEPNNAKALWLLGHWKYQRADYQGAIRNWQQVANLLPAGDDNIAIIEQQIQQAKRALADSGVVLAAEDSPPVSSAPTPVSGSQIKVTVALDPSLTGQAAAEDTVFVFARAVEGPKMPLAIVRKQVKDLPVTVTLDDSSAMSPAMVLSNFPEVTVGARISKSGQAIPQSGDLQGTVTPVASNADQTVELMINTRIP